MTPRSVHRSFCRICVGVCGIEVEVDDGRVIAVRGDAEHPISAGYTCGKGRALGAVHADPGRLDAPLVRRAGGALEPAAWDDALADIEARLGDIVRESGPDAVGFFLGGGIMLDAAGYWAARRLQRRWTTKNLYSTMSIDSAPKYRVGELMAGTYALMPHADPDARLVLMFGTNPVVSHGQSPMFENPVERLRAAGDRGEVWVVDPRTTESARLATHHLAVRPGTDHAVLAFLVRSLLAAGVDRDALARRASNVDALAAAVEPYTAAHAAAITGVDEADLERLLDAVVRAGRLAVLTGTGVTMSRGGNAVEWLAWALLVVTDSFDQPGGMWFNPGYLARLDQRASLPEARPGDAPPPTRPDLAPLLGEWPAAVIPDEIEAGNLRALIVFGSNPVTSLPDTPRVAAAFGRLDALVVADVVPTATTDLATHVLPCHAQLERPDVGLLNDLFNPVVAATYTAAVLPQHDNRRSAWWIVDRIGRALGVDVLPDGVDARTATDDDILALATGADVLDQLRSGERPWATAPSPVFDWVQARLPHGAWDLAPAALVEHFATIDVAPSLVLTPRRQSKRMNTQTMRDGDRPEVMVHPDDAAAASVADGDLVEVTSASGSLLLRARVTDATRRGALSIPHGWADCNVNVLVSARDLDPLTGMPRSSGTEVSLRRVEADVPVPAAVS